MSSLYNSAVPYLKLEEKIAAITCLGDEPKPGLIFEGKTDVAIYSRVLKLSDPNLIKEIDIVIGECKSKIVDNHLQGEIPFKYIALIDSDFDFFRNTVLDNSFILYTDFYDMENYLTTIDVIESTFEDMNDFNTRNIVVKTLYDDMLECLYPYIASVKYKLHYLLKSNINENNKKLFSIEDESIFNEKWWDKKNSKVSENKMKNFIIDFSNKNNENFNEELWIKMITETKDQLKYDIDIKQIQSLVKGRRLIEAYKITFDKYLGKITKDRNREIFKNDLRKNITKSQYIQDLVLKLNKKLETIV